jgi:flagellar biosynthesis protein FlhG
VSARTATVIAVASGKGGVGKTNVAVNLSVALARLGHRVGLVDADFGLGNVDVLLGLAPERHIGQLLTGEASLDDLMVSGPAGVQIVPASSGMRELTTFTMAQRAILADAFTRLRGRFDFLLIDTAAGISDTVIDSILLADRAAVVTSVEPAAIVDAYATVKVLTTVSPATEVGIVVNRVRTAEDASAAFKQLEMAALRFLRRSLKFYGFITEDALLRESVLVQRPVVEDAPQSDASRCFRLLAARVAALAPVAGAAVKTPFARTAVTAAVATVPVSALGDAGAAVSGPSGRIEGLALSESTGRVEGEVRPCE